MLDIQYIRDHADEVQQNAAHRNITVDISLLLKRDEQLRNHIRAVDQLREQRNINAETLKQLKNKQSAEAAELIERGKELKAQISEIDAGIDTVRAEYIALMEQVPNLTHPEVPVGKTDEDNAELRVVGGPTVFDFEPKDHLQIGADLDLYDFERGADVAGSGFYYVKNGAAVMDLALQRFALDRCMSEGFTPMITPDLAKPEVLRGTGFNPRGEEKQIYNIEGEELSLIATSEITVGGYFRNHTFEQDEIDEPKKFVGLSHCYRTEAGAYGRESRGLYRVHQFSKVEMFIFCRPEQSEAMHDHVLEIEEGILQDLKIPYRVVDCCTGDLGAPAFRKYDIEAWMPFKDGWGEVTSTSNCTDYQSRRLNIKYVNDNGKKELVHTLNGTAVATSRVPIAIIENFQQQDGTVAVPDVLHPYMSGVTTLN